jgi:hypothetical protein
MSVPTTKTELLAIMQKSHAAFEARLAPFSAAQLTTPFMDNGWSIRDMLVHITTWQQRGVIRLEAVRLNQEPNTPLIRTAEESDRFTREQLLANRERTPAEVWEAFRSAYRQLLAGVEALDEEVLFERGRFAWMDGDALWACPLLYTEEHYTEHTLDIERFLVTQKQKDA